MRKNLRLRPEVEGLESMMLLSTMHSGVVEVAKKPPVTTISGPVVLTGTARGTYRVTNPLTETASVTAKGNLKATSTATRKSLSLLSSSFSTTLTLVAPTPHTVTVKSNQGSLTLFLSPVVVSLASLTGSASYTVESGTGKLAKVTGGTGHVTVMLLPKNGIPTSTTGTFTASFS